MTQDLRTEKFVKKILATYGWPTSKMVGKRGAHSFWLLTQHMDQDLPFQESALALLEKAVSDKQADIRDWAYLTDRVLKNQNKKQTYGTQFLIRNKKLVPYMIKDSTHVDERRKSVGLNTLEEYKKTLELEYKNLLK